MGKGHKTKPGEQAKSPVSVIKWFVIVIVALVVAANVLGRRSGNRGDRGSAVQGERCVASNDCATGYRCYNYLDEPFQCHKVCHNNDDCGEGMHCQTQAISGRRQRLKTLRICVAGKTNNK